jgi:hypothetical protein
MFIPIWLIIILGILILGVFILLGYFLHGLMHFMDGW